MTLLGFTARGSRRSDAPWGSAADCRETPAKVRDCPHHRFEVEGRERQLGSLPLSA